MSQWNKSVNLQLRNCFLKSEHFNVPSVPQAQKNTRHHKNSKVVLNELTKWVHNTFFSLHSFLARDKNDHTMVRQVVTYHQKLFFVLPTKDRIIPIRNPSLVHKRVHVAETGAATYNMSEGRQRRTRAGTS